jgi:hypothetical protein
MQEIQFERLLATEPFEISHSFLCILRSLNVWWRIDGSVGNKGGLSSFLIQPYPGIQLKMTARSGEYAVCVRYKCAGIGVDTEKWHLSLIDEEERARRHRAALSALADGFLSPQGALTATMLPHLTGLQGLIVIRTSTGRAPLYSALVPDFAERLSKLAGESSLIFQFDSIDTFYEQMQALIHFSTPALPARFQARVEAPAVSAPLKQQKGEASRS